MKDTSHQNQIPNLRRIEGQIKGIQTMVEGNQYCIDILNQIKAAKSALSSVENKILNKHIEECIENSLSSDKQLNDKIEELMKVLKRK
ncbi:MAG TPA: transcriptional regulator [Gammaproteobacteria bacterium]|jgi:DNA-binding FrmR family transcriptional regulator|nr:transcriptional regulator [Gammaproteobacteria bacterium]HIK72213.1 transcriptional regulator [Gammaproteobacteria bacterium]|tara:strand:- start:128 stop:391 length:264 start_codon:yes stop_codon:yes gene_type:complete